MKTGEGGWRAGFAGCSLSLSKSISHGEKEILVEFKIRLHRSVFVQGDSDDDGIG